MLSSVDVDNMISDIRVINDVIVSDHRLLSLCLQCIAVQCSVPASAPHSRYIPDWNHCADSTLAYYGYYLDTLLQTVDVPLHIYTDSIKPASYTTAIDKFYTDITDCINKATAACIPVYKLSKTDYNVHGWNTYVADKHEIARSAYLLWRETGKR